MPASTLQKYLEKTEINGKIKRRKMIKNILISACCFVFVAVVCLGIAKKELNVKKTEKISDGKTTQNNILPQDEEATSLLSGFNNDNHTEENSASAEIKEKEKLNENENGVNINYNITTKKSETKGGNTSEIMQDYTIGPDGVSYYKIFKPGVDKFNPKDSMTLENRFCSFNFNNKSYYPAKNGDIAENDYEPELLKAVKASMCELLTPDEDVVGIEYVARIEIYKLKGIDIDEAVACKVIFNGETKLYKYLATEKIYPDKN